MRGFVVAADSMEFRVVSLLLAADGVTAAGETATLGWCARADGAGSAVHEAAIRPRVVTASSEIVWRMELLYRNSADGFRRPESRWLRVG